MARLSKKAEQRKQELISSVPVDQRKMITQPITFAYLNGEMSVMHARIQTIIMEKLQVRLAKAMRDRFTGGFVGDLFTDDDFAPLEGEDNSDQYVKFVVKYSELGIDPANYRFVSAAARAMQGSLVYEKEVNGYVRSITAFPVIDVPDETKKERRTDIKLYMTRSTAKYLFDMRGEFHRYLKDAIFLFSGSYTGRIYLLINSNKYRGTWTVGYEELRKILLTTYDKDKKRYVVDKYRDINDFKKRVLEPARKEIAEASDHIDCTFDYEFIYPAGKRRGTPEKIAFHIHLTDLGRNIKKKQLENQESAELRTLLMSLHLSATEASRLMKEALKLIPANQYALLADKAKALKTYYAEEKEGKRPKIDNYRSYSLKSLRDFIQQQSFTPAEEIPAENTLSTAVSQQSTAPTEAHTPPMLDWSND